MSWEEWADRYRESPMDEYSFCMNDYDCDQPFCPEHNECDLWEGDDLEEEGK